MWPSLSPPSAPLSLVSSAGVVNPASRCLLSCSAGHLRLLTDQGGGWGVVTLCHTGEM